jgi:hypothetical protein
VRSRRLPKPKMADFGRFLRACPLLADSQMRSGKCAVLALVWTLLAGQAAAQSTTEDGIRAVIRGDYQVAARILRPRADDPARPDPVAQFFLAFLYETGRGVRADMGRACGLFLRSAQRPHPFAEQSAAIAAYLREQLADGASLLCVADERWQGGPPQSIVLGPDHRIVFADTSVTVEHGDESSRTIMIPPRGTFLPIGHTPLDVSKPTAMRRHFLHWFWWSSDSPLNPSSWTLGWVLSEVVNDQWTYITGEKSLVVASGAIRPESLDVTSLVRLRVNAGGEAELTIVGGPSPRTEVIPWKGSR